MNDADWLRKHLRGKAQRAGAETPTSTVRSKVRGLVKRAARKVLGSPREEPAQEEPNQS